MNSAELEKDAPTPSIICFLKDGVWHADLLTKYNRSKDETIFLRRSSTQMGNLAMI